MILISTCAEERSEPEKGIYIGYWLVVRKRAIATVVGAKPGSVNDQLQQRLYGGWLGEGGAAAVQEQSIGSQVLLPPPCCSFLCWVVTGGRGRWSKKKLGIQRILL